MGRESEELEDAVTFNAQATGARLVRRPVGRVCDTCCTDTEEKTGRLAVDTIHLDVVHLIGSVTYVC